MKHIFIIGSKGIPAQYGGFETFVDRLVQNRKSNEIQYHVACMGNETKEFTYHDARCFQIKVPEIGSAKAVYYDMLAVRSVLSYVKNHHIEDAVLYILACRIGPFIGHYQDKLQRRGVRLMVNPDGHEWMRGKWNAAIRRYWKWSESLMVKHAGLLVCDSKNIEVYIHTEYGKYRPETTFLAYGADMDAPMYAEAAQEVKVWYEQHDVRPGEFYLVVGRFVPENNYETIIREFMKSDTKKELVFITNVEHNKYYETLEERTNFQKDTRIKFVGTVYENKLINRIRKDAFAYVHGHEVGGTNPSLLEAMSITDVNLLLGVGFNREVGEHGALYWKKEPGDLCKLMKEAETMTPENRENLGELAKQRIQKEYSWDYIVSSYEKLFMAGDNAPM
ncbi:MAG: DUF1972 domain-containing protein [Lachnospiraceae bacterium]|nr:DUF1972 domain-containing protein [Lachnospiraceae bacterium]